MQCARPLWGSSLPCDGLHPHTGSPNKPLLPHCFRQSLCHRNEKDNKYTNFSRNGDRTCCRALDATTISSMPKPHNHSREGERRGGREREIWRKFYHKAFKNWIEQYIKMTVDRKQVTLISHSKLRQARQFSTMEPHFVLGYAHITFFISMRWATSILRLHVLYPHTISPNDAWTPIPKQQHKVLHPGNTDLESFYSRVFLSGYEELKGRSGLNWFGVQIQKGKTVSSSTV